MMRLPAIFRRKPVTALLAEHSIPSPTRVMADLLALKIAQLPNNYEGKGPYKANCGGMTKIPLDGERFVGIVLEEEKEGHWPNEKTRIIVKVTLYAPQGRKGTMSYYHDATDIELAPEEQSIIYQQMVAWQERALAEIDAKRDGASQNAAIDVIQSLIGAPKLEAPTIQ